MEMSDFLSPLRFFEYHINNVLESLHKSENLRCDFPSCLCQFGCKSKKRADLMVSIPGKQPRNLEILAIKDNMCQHPVLQTYLVYESIDKFGKINFSLNRNSFMKDTIRMVVSNGFNYGQKSSGIGQRYLVNNGDMLTKLNSCMPSNGEVQVGALRTLLLYDHVIKILNQDSSNIVAFCAQMDVSSNKRNLQNIFVFELFGLLYSKTASVTPSKFETTKIQLKASLLESKYRLTEDGARHFQGFRKSNEHLNIDLHCSCKINVGAVQTDEQQDSSDLHISHNICTSCNNHEEELHGIRSCDYTKLNLYQYIEDLKKAKSDKDEGDIVLDKNLKEVKVSLIWDALINLEIQECTSDMESAEGENRKIIHICGQENKFKLHQISVAWRLLSRSNIAKKQVFLCHSSVTFVNNACQNTSQSITELVRVRTRQVKHSYFMKYGAAVNDEKWTDTIAKISTAVIKLEILTTPMKNQVKLDVTDTNECPSSCRQSLFILYNCARLAKILEHHNNAVDEGLYPPLPDVDMVDFVLLKDEAEWNLFMTYVVRYPDVVADTRESLERFSRMITFKSNKIAQFLVSLSKDISVYYSRVHILGESKSHLFPVMFAKIYLIKALHQVMKNALYLLGIESVDQM